VWGRICEFAARQLAQKSAAKKPIKDEQLGLGPRALVFRSSGRAGARLCNARALSRAPLPQPVRRDLHCARAVCSACGSQRLGKPPARSLAKRLARLPMGNWATHWTAARLGPQVGRFMAVGCSVQL